MKKILTKLILCVVALALSAGFVSANTTVNVQFFGIDDMLSKAAMKADVYKNHARRYHNLVVGMIPISVAGQEQQAYCFDIGTKVVEDTADFDQILVKEAAQIYGESLLSDENVDRIAYIVDQFPLGTLGTEKAKIRGAVIQNAVWRLLYGDSPLYTVYPPFPTSDIPVTDDLRVGDDLVIETTTTAMLQASEGKRLLEGNGTGSLQLTLTPDPNNSDRVLVVLSAVQGTSPTCGQPVSLYTDSGVFEGSGADFILGVTDAQGLFQTAIDLSNVTWSLVATCHNKPKPNPCPNPCPDPEPETHSITVAAEASGRSVYLLLSQGDAYQDMIFTQPGDYATSATCAIEEETFDGTPRTIGFWKHQVKCALQGKKAQVSAQTLRSFLPIWILGGVRVDSLSEMYSILWLQKATMRQRAQQQYLATMLNIAWGQLEWNERVDVNYDKRPDMPLWQAILTAKLAFSWGYYEVAKNICDSINNSGDPDASATTFAAAGNARKR